MNLKWCLQPSDHWVDCLCCVHVDRWLCVITRVCTCIQSKERFKGNVAFVLSRWVPFGSTAPIRSVVDVGKMLFKKVYSNHLSEQAKPNNRWLVWLARQKWYGGLHYMSNKFGKRSRSQATGKRAAFDRVEVERIWKRLRRSVVWTI